MSKWKYEVILEMEDEDALEVSEQLSELVKKMFGDSKTYYIGGSRQ